MSAKFPRGGGEQDLFLARSLLYIFYFFIMVQFGCGIAWPHSIAFRYLAKTVFANSQMYVRRLFFYFVVHKTYSNNILITFYYFGIIVRQQHNIWDNEHTWDPGPEVIKLFSCSTQLSTKFILLINVKMPKKNNC